MRVETISAAAAAAAAIDNPLAEVVQRLAKPRPHLPKDYALNHGHYLHGEPKR